MDDAVLALVEEMDGFDRTCKSSAICVSEEDDVYYNYHDGREYRVREEVGYGSPDDAEEYLYIWLQKVPTPEEAEKERLCQEKQNRKRRLERGKAVCREYLLAPEELSENE